MKTVYLEYNNINFEVTVDNETFEQLKDENVKAVYASQVYEAMKGAAVTSDKPGAFPKPFKLECNENEPGPSHCCPETVEFKWTSKIIELLLNIRLGMEAAFNNPVCKKKKLWDKVASQMTKIGGYAVSGEICDMKYRNLLTTYRGNKRRKETSGESSIKWEFFNMMDEVLGYKASSSPAPHLIGSTLCDEQSVEESAEGNVGEPSKKKLKIGKENQMSVPQYLYLKMEQDKLKNEKREKREEERWKEKKILKEKEIDALNNLANAISNSLKK